MLFAYIYFLTKFAKDLIDDEIIDGFTANGFFVKSFDYMGMGHFRIKKTKRGKTYYNRCNCLPKRLRNIREFQRALFNKELIIIVPIPEVDHILNVSSKSIIPAVNGVVTTTRNHIEGKRY